MGYDGERPIVEIPVMLTKYEIQTLLRWRSHNVNDTIFDIQLAERLEKSIPQEEEDVW